MNKQFFKPWMLLTTLVTILMSAPVFVKCQTKRFNVLVLASRAKDHLKMISAAKPFLEKMGAENNFSVDFTDDSSKINTDNLARYQVFVMLDLAPFDMSYSQQAALQRFVEEGNGWVGIHAAGLTGKQFLAPGTRYWQWFEDFMGGVVYSPHPAYQKGTVIIEDHKHPAMEHLPEKLEISDEWYEYNKSPRAHVRVLATADESTYKQNKPMGDHPIIWTNERYRRMIYIGIGHDPSILNNEGYDHLLRDAILWAGSSGMPMPMKNGIIHYEKKYGPEKDLDGKERYKRAMEWFARSGPRVSKKIKYADEEEGKIAGTGMFRVVTGNAGNYYELKFDINITVTDTGCSFSTGHYYEKSVEKGISNEYSKIGYRWWDFRQGKPWSAEDSMLFAGLDSNSLALRSSFEQFMSPRFRVLVLYENGGHHIDYSKRAVIWLNKLASDSNFRIDYVTNTDSLNEEFLSKYGLVIQLDYAPYAWKPDAVSAFQHYIDQGKGGWIGFHHASLLGEFDGYPMWPWFWNFMGGIRWKDYIARFASATVHVEDHLSPVMKGVPDSFTVQKEEWYTYDKSPRPRVHVIANVDESSYRPDTTIKMGDHPVIWTNEQVKARNVYIFMGHSPILFDDSVYRRIFCNAIFWASEKPKPAFKALAFYSTTVESDHVDFAKDAIRFYSRLAAEKNFVFDTTTNWENLNEVNLKNYQELIWLNDFPHTEQQRNAFQHYMEKGGAWLGFHVSGYNDKDTKWPWFVRFFGGAAFYNNNWPPLPAKLLIDDTLHAVTRHMPASYTAPINEWYGWDPDPRLNKDVRVLITLDPVNYPLGKKDIITHGDIPVVWTNTRYRMLYMNMGHGDQIFKSDLQNRLFENAIWWLGTKGNPK
ncbi:MAG: ThuA domain-containing protein [Bacteroidota bacterium]|nr:ThuA domain-containing protein [Bacteroidota bacterium]